MLELGTLGGLSVSGGTPLGRAAVQPRRLALLALLAEAGPKGVTRDSLIGLLWPAQPEESARHSLTQTLYALRRDLAADALFLGTSRLQLNPAVVTCDLWRFRAALAAGQWQKAVEAYQGGFLAGFHLAGAHEFDRWCEGRRLECAADAARALERLAAESTARQAHGEAVEWYRRLALMEPHNARVAGLLARAMRDGGDRAGAITSIHEFGARVREELALPLDPGLVALSDEIRRELRGSGGPDGAPTPPRPPSPGEPGKPPLAEAAPAGGGRPRRWPRWGIPLAAAGVLAVAAAVSNTRLLSREPAPGPAGQPIVVLPIVVRGEPGPAYLPEGLARLIANGLDGVGLLRATVFTPTDPDLESAVSGADTTNALRGRLEVARYVAGEAIVVNGRVQLRAELHDATRRGALLGVARATGPADSAFRLAEDVTRELLGFEPTAGPGTMIRNASENTTSLAAFQAFIEAEGHFRASRFGEAVSAYQRALQLDSTFALAWYRLAEAADWNALAQVSQAAAAAAQRFAYRLPERVQLLLEAGASWRNGYDDEAERVVRLITGRYPNDADAWSQLAEILFHANPIRGRSFTEAEAPFERVLQLDPGNRGALTHLARIRAYQGNPEESDSLLLAAAVRMDGGLDPEMAMFRAVVTGNASARGEALERLAAGQTFVFVNAVHRILAFTREPAMADTVLARVASAGGSPDTRFQVYFFRTQVAAALGQFRRALALSNALGEVNHGRGIELRSLIAVLPQSQQSPAILRTTRAEVAAAPAEVLPPLMRFYLLGLLDLEAGDTANVPGWIDSLRAMGTREVDPRGPRTLAAGLLARLLVLRGDSAAALAELNQGRTPDPATRGNLFGSQNLERFLRARLLERAGRNEEALAVYASVIYGEPNSSLLAAPAALLRARLLARLGRRDEARVEYRTALRAWEHADAELRPVVDSAARELRALR